MDLDERLKRIIALLQEKDGMPLNKGRLWNYQFKSVLVVYSYVR